MKLRTNIYLEVRQSEALDEAARARGISRAELVRQLIDKAIGVDAAVDLEADLAAIDASFGALSDADSFETLSRGPDDRARHLHKVASRGAEGR